MAAGAQSTPGEEGHRPVAEMLASWFGGLDAGAYVMDDQARILAVNPRAEALLRRPEAGFLGQDAHDLMHRDAKGGTAPRSACRLLEAFLGSKTTLADEWFATGDGALLPVSCFATPYLSEDGVAGAMVLFCERAPDEPSERLADYVAALEDLTDRLALAAETTTVLTSTLDLDEALHRLVRLVVPRFADWAIVDLLGEDDDLVGDSRRLRRVAVAHGEGGDHVRVEELEGPMPPASETARSPLSRILRGGPPTLVVPEDFSPATSEIAAVQRDLFAKTGIHSAVIAPLRGVRGVLGALTVGRSEQKRPFDASGLALVDDIARRAGLAVDNVHLYEQQRRVAETMQRHLLPPLPDIGLEMAARYVPAPSGSQVGGDWYDAFLLPDGMTALVIGDVAGHDLQAAAHMSQVRNMLRAITWEHEEPPSLIIRRLDRAMAHISEVTMATLILARIEGEAGGPWQLHWSSAGHPPPLLVSEDGEVHYLEEGHGVLLGTGLDQERTDAAVPLPPLTTVVLYTDGLVEAPGMTLDKGFAELRRHACELARHPLDEFCDALLRRARPPDNEDDIALLAVRVPAPGDTASASQEDPAGGDPGRG